MGTIRANIITDASGGNTTVINGVTPALATQAEAEAGTDNTKLMTPLRVTEAVLSDFNVTGSAPLYACRAWVNFNGTGTVAIRASGNVTSITDRGVGLYTINFATPMPDANYSISTTIGSGAASDQRVSPYIGAPPATTSLALNYIHANTLYYDWEYITVAIFR
jgi:hypothetical protein